MTARIAWTVLATLVTLGVLWWLLTDEVIAALDQALARAGLGRLGAAMALVPVIQWLRAWRFSLLLSGRSHLPSAAMFGVAARLLLFNFVLPFKLGELSFPVLMRRAFATGYARSAGILILARLMDLCVVAAILMLGTALVLEPSAFGWSRWALMVAGVAALIVPVLTVHALRLIRWPAVRLPRLSRLLEQLTSGTAMVRPLPRSLLAQAITAATWLTHSAIAYLTASAIAPDLPVIPVILAGAANNLAFALPVTGIAGLGPPQAAWATVLHWTGASWEVAAITALVCHGVVLIGVAATSVAGLLVPDRPLQRRAASYETSSTPES